MFEIYLPIAEVNINLITLTIVSLFAGFFSGLLGIGGGWIITPILIFLGIPPTFAVANGANNVLAASVSGSLSHWFKGQLDIKMGLLISVGGIVGSFIGIFIFKFFFVLGVVNNLIYILYCIFLTSIGISMLIESLVEIRRISQNRFIRRKLHKHYWVHNLPFKIRLHKSHLYISIIPPIFFGAIIGIMSSLIGVGGGFLLVPIMIYILGMPARLVPGTSLFIMIFIMIFVVLLHAINHDTVDIYLAIILVVGSVVGAQVGTKIGMKLKNEEIRATMSILVLIFGLKFGYDLFFGKVINQISKLGNSLNANNSIAEFVVNTAQNFPGTYAISTMLVCVIFAAISAYAFKKFI